MRLVLAVLTLSACFNPSYPEGRACSDDGLCPGELICNPSTQTCLVEITAVDAAADVFVPIDAAIDAPPPLPCVEGDVQGQDPASGNCYVVLEQNNNWANAQLACEAAGPGLRGASITSAAENAFVQSLVGGTNHWMGGNDIDVENAFVWTSGELFVFENWANGEPNNGDNNEDCIIYLGTSGGVWDDRNCGSNDSVLCERVR